MTSNSTWDPIDAVADFLIEDRGATRVLVTSISEHDVCEIVRSPTALIGSDGNCVATYGTVSQGLPHPRFYGTFPASSAITWASSASSRSSAPCTR